MQPIQAHQHTIFFNESAYDALNNHLKSHKYSKIFILVDNLTNEYCLPKFLPLLSTDAGIEIIEIENGELHKNINTCIQVWNVLLELGGDRKSLLINLGGGIITDLGGFIAATFKRGIDFINIPTTLLGIVDAAIGSKNGIDLGSLKNQIGTIASPQMILIDSQFLETLPQNQMKSGLAEMLKHGLIYDKEYWDKFIDLSKIDFADFDTLIYQSVKIKSEIVSQDLTENGIRKALNFGHTLGHAIESYFLDHTSQPPLLHGEAIAVGMILESHLALQKKLITVAEYHQIKSVINHIFNKIFFTENDIKSIQNLLIHDKKNEYGKVQFALLNGIGNSKINEIADNEMIMLAFDDYKK